MDSSSAALKPENGLVFLPFDWMEMRQSWDVWALSCRTNHEWDVLTIKAEAEQTENGTKEGPAGISHVCSDFFARDIMKRSEVQVRSSVEDAGQRKPR